MNVLFMESLYKIARVMLVLYRDLQTMIVFEFEDFLSNFEKVLSDTTLCNSSFTTILGDFNARSDWWTRDKT